MMFPTWQDAVSRLFGRTAPHSRLGCNASDKAATWLIEAVRRNNIGSAIVLHSQYRDYRRNRVLRRYINRRRLQNRIYRYSETKFGDRRVCNWLAKTHKHMSSDVHPAVVPMPGKCEPKPVQLLLLPVGEYVQGYHPTKIERIAS